MTTLFYITMLCYLTNNPIFIGNWYFCNEEGLYSEMRFNYNYFEVIYAGINNIYEYRIEKDTLIINLEDDLSIKYIGYFKYIDEDKIIFYYKCNNCEEWLFIELNRIKEKIVETNDKNWYKDYQRRMENSTCKKLYDY